MCTVRAEPGATSGLAWGRLYGIALTTIAAGVTVDALGRARPWHHILATCVVAAGFGAMLVWVRANRVALSVADTCDCAAERLRIRVVESRRGRPRLRPPGELDAPVLEEAPR